MLYLSTPFSPLLDHHRGSIFKNPSSVHTHVIKGTPVQNCIVLDPPVYTALVPTFSPLFGILGFQFSKILPRYSPTLYKEPLYKIALFCTYQFMLCLSLLFHLFLTTLGVQLSKNPPQYSPTLYKVSLCKR